MGTRRKGRATDPAWAMARTTARAMARTTAWAMARTTLTTAQTMMPTQRPPTPPRRWTRLRLNPLRTWRHHRNSVNKGSPRPGATPPSRESHQQTTWSGRSVARFPWFGRPGGSRFPSLVNASGQFILVATQPLPITSGTQLGLLGPGAGIGDPIAGTSRLEDRLQFGDGGIGQGLEGPDPRVQEKPIDLGTDAFDDDEIILPILPGSKTKGRCGLGVGIRRRGSSECSLQTSVLITESGNVLFLSLSLSPATL